MRESDNSACGAHPLLKQWAQWAFNYEHDDQLLQGLVEKTTSTKTAQEKFKLQNKYLCKLKNVIAERNSTAIVILISYSEGL